MALSLLTTVGERMWAKCPMTLKFNAFGEPTTSSVIVRIETSLGDYIGELRYPIISWLVQVPVMDLIKAVFAAAPFPPEWKVAGIVEKKAQSIDRVRGIVIKYRLSTAAPGTETSVYAKVIDGGIATMNFAKSFEINEYATFSPAAFFPRGVRFFTHLPSGRTIDADMVAWIPFFSYQDLKPTAQYYMQYLDGSTGYVSRIFPFRTNYTDTFWEVPVGISQMNLDPDNKGIYKMSLYLVSGGDGEIPLGQYDIHYNYKPRYTWVDIGFQNSLGGWDCVRFDGAIKMSNDVERKEYEVGLIAKDYFNATGTNNYFDSKSVVQWQCNSGYISAKEIMAYTDLLHSKDVRVFFNGDWLPVKCITKKLQWRDSGNNLYAAEFEFESAGSFDVLPAEQFAFFDKYPELR